jgi:hypothetical protein
MRAVVAKQNPSPRVGEIKALGRELADAYRGRVGQYKHEQGLTTQEAVANADQPRQLPDLWRALDCPPEEVTWEDLEALNRHGPERALERWEEVRQAAREELRSGRLADAALQGRNNHPWRRAQFLAIRDELAEGWQPRNGLERLLIDQMAQAQAAINFWMERLADVASWAGDKAVLAPLEMVDRFHRMFQRSLRALVNLRRSPLAVVFQKAGQVNVAGNQVNLNGGEP